MKYLLPTLFATLLSLTIYAQCDAPVVESWSAPAVDSITVNFTTPADAQSYTLEITGEYGILGINDYIFNAPLILTGTTTSGLNTVNFDASGVISPAYSQLANYYYSASLSVICANGDTSAINHFYVSQFSILNDPGYNIGDLFFKPMTALPDVPGITFDSYITVPASDSPQQIDNISVFIDLGHTYNGDLSIELISPFGTSVSLLNFPSQLFSTVGFSVIFKDGYPVFDFPAENGSPGPRGIFAPSEPLSVLSGQSPEGVWVVRVEDNLGIDDGMLFGVGLIINSSPCISTLSGKAFYDMNANNMQDTLEPGFSNAIIENSLDDQQILTNSNGHFADCSNAGDGMLSLINTPDYYTVDDISLSVSDGEELNDLDFAIQPIPGNNDLQVDLYAVMPDRPGFDNTYIVHYQNIGTECIDNTDIHINLDSLLLITDVSNGDITFSGNSADLNIGELCPLEGGSFSLTTFLNDTVSIDTELSSMATITPVAGDQNNSDNISEYQSIVVGSFDPNDKTVSAHTINPTIVESGTPLKYMVRFQNTGNYLAERVLVVDTLDENLDINSFELTSASHDVDITRNGNIFYFTFENINLPDSATDQTGSHGFIRYQIKPNSGLADGTEIENTAYIFFDFNPPIVTNTTTTLMDFSTGIAEQSFEARVFPNPAQDQISLEWLPDVDVQQINLLDISGKMIKHFTVSGKNRTTIAVDKLPAGVYIFQFRGPDTVKPTVWIKK